MAKPNYEIPIRIRDRIELQIETLASSGDGLCRYSGYTIFVPTAIPGDHIVGEIVKTTPRFGVAHIIERLAPSLDRVAPPCPVFPECGGCKLQQLSYEKQLEFKAQVVRQDLKRIGNLKITVPIQTVPANPYWFYRNKGSFAVQMMGEKLQIGFFKQGTHNVVNSNDCEILYPPINAIKEIVRHGLESYKISIYNETTHKGFVRGIIVRFAQKTGEALLGLVTTQGKFPKGFIETLRDEINNQKISLSGIVQNLNMLRTNVILGNRSRILWGRDHMIDQLDHLKFRVSLSSFFQVNAPQTVKIYNLIRDWVRPTEGTIVDAYCGVGSIALWLSQEGRDVIGIEAVPEAVNDAIKNAQQNKILSCRFLAGSVEDQLQAIGETEKIATIILDPPRKGCSEKVIQSLSALKPSRLIYVSCNPATLARDLAKLKDLSFIVQEIYVVDMFPQTQHIEVAVLLASQ